MKLPIHGMPYLVSLLFGWFHTALANAVPRALPNSVTVAVAALTLL